MVYRTKENLQLLHDKKGFSDKMLRPASSKSTLIKQQMFNSDIEKQENIQHQNTQNNGTGAEKNSLGQESIDAKKNRPGRKYTTQAGCIERYIWSVFLF